MPLNATAVGLIGRNLFPGILQTGYLYTLAGYDVYLGEVAAAIAALLFIGFINLRGGRSAGWMQTAVTFGSAGSVLLIGTDVLLSRPDVSNLQPPFPQGVSAFRAVFAIAAMTPWAFLGFDCIPQAAEEFNFPPRRTLKIMLSAIGLAALMYMIVNTATAAVRPGCLGSDRICVLSFCVEAFSSRSPFKQTIGGISPTRRTFMTIYYGGPILTLDPSLPRIEALLTADGIIAARGDLEKLKALAPEARLVSLEGRTLMPAFVDGHSHLAATGIHFNRCDLFGCTSFEELLERIRIFRKKRDLTHGELILCSGYDHNNFKEGAHPTRALLDTLGVDNPIICYHQSVHMLVCNTLVLELCGLDDSYTPPASGDAGRDEAGHLTGYFEEGAMAAMQPCLKQHTETEADVEKAILEAQDYYLRQGYTTLQDGSPNGAQRLALYERLADEGKLKADVVVYMSAGDPALWDEVYARRGRDYRNHLKFGGIKIVLDGSPQARTAWMRQPYAGSSDYSGYPTQTDKRVRQVLAHAADHSVQVLAHCNGDAAAEQFLSLWEETVAHAGHGEELRLVMIHAQLVGYDQLDRMKAVGMMPSFFVGHCYFWGDVHLKNFGADRGSRISPVKAAIRRSLPYNFHQDTPVTPPSMLHSIWCAVNRITRSGVCVGPDNRITVEEALIGATQGGAYSYFEEGRKGILIPGAQADLVILSDDPTAVPPETLKDLQVMETIKEGVTLFKA